MSRLDRLVTLLDTGTTSYVRNVSANQLANLAKLHQVEIKNFISKVFPYLLSVKWETRTSAAKAFGGIIDNAEVWDPNCDESDVNVKTEDINDYIKKNYTNMTIPKMKDFTFNYDRTFASESEFINFDYNNILTFDLLDIEKILKSDKKLLSFKLTSDCKKIDTNNINDVSINQSFESEDKIFAKISDIYDLKSENGKNVFKKQNTNLFDINKDVSNIFLSLETKASKTTSSSARLKAVQKRRAKTNLKSNIGKPSLNKTTNVNFQENLNLKISADVKVEDENVNFNDKSFQNSDTGSKDFIIPDESDFLEDSWEYQKIYELLLKNLFNDNWELRHGSALGLRELIKKHAKAAGRTSNQSKFINDINNFFTLQDLAVRLCILFTIDRFADYVSSSVVAPVRESAAQTLATLLLHLDDKILIETFNYLYILVKQNHSQEKIWEVRYGGLLGLKYFISVKMDLVLSHDDLFNKVIEMVLPCLKENDDIIQSVASSILSQISFDLIKKTPESIESLLDIIWDLLLNIKDDLSSSIGSIMDLLAKLFKHKEVLEVIKKNSEHSSKFSINGLIMKLFCFLRHPITNVRKSVLLAINEIASIDDPMIKDWLNVTSLRLIFQNILLEQNDDILLTSKKVYDVLLVEYHNNKNIKHPSNLDSVFVSNFYPLLSLIMTPIGIGRNNYQMNEDHFLKLNITDFTLFNLSDLKNYTLKMKKRKISNTDLEDDIHDKSLDLCIDLSVYKGDVLLVGYEKFILMRKLASQAYGNTLSFLNDDKVISSVLKLLFNYLNSPFFSPRLFSALIIQEYSESLKKKKLSIDHLNEHFENFFDQTIKNPSKISFFKELIPSLNSLRFSCLRLYDVFINTVKLDSSSLRQIPPIDHGKNQPNSNIFSIDVAKKIVTNDYSKILNTLSSQQKLLFKKKLDDEKKSIELKIEDVAFLYESKVICTLSAFSSAYLSFANNFNNLGFIVKSLMASIKKEKIEILKSLSANTLSILIQKFQSSNQQNLIDRIIENLFLFVCNDYTTVPIFIFNKQTDIIFFFNKEKFKIDPDLTDLTPNQLEELKTKKTNALFTFNILINHYKDQIFIKIPKLYDIMINPIKLLVEIEKGADENQVDYQLVLDSVSILSIISLYYVNFLHEFLTDMLVYLLSGLKSKYSVFRHVSSKCIASICFIQPVKTFTFIIDMVLPLLKKSTDFRHRQAAIESILHVCMIMKEKILPYLIFLILPVLARMSDFNEEVRFLASTTFASIITLIPLESAIPDPVEMPERLFINKQKERLFLEQMMNPNKLISFEVPFKLKIELRKYQQHGLNWLAFLSRYNLHGILCDDMGLGKTLQTICMIASDHYLKCNDINNTDVTKKQILPSIIICPSSLLGHWEYEFKSYAPFLSVLLYTGSPNVRISLRSQISDVNILITSYDVIRNDIEFLSDITFNYCVLDEGHIIRNSTSKLSISVKKIKSDHRLILSGTPVQNNVFDLWSLFDFLMPGFLGSEKMFNEKFSKPIASTRTGKITVKEQEASALALESLHKQVSPFMLRRLKENVLSDLPPKIVQDYYTTLGDLQKKLYNYFINKQKSVFEQIMKLENESKIEKSHIFQVLLMLKKICNHPALVLTPKSAVYNDFKSYIQKNKINIKSAEHSPKLLCLKSILLECGIGVNDINKDSKICEKNLNITSDVISQHRALIFCQLREMLDIIENELLKKLLPSVTYIRLDGNTEPKKRQSIVQLFNEDPSIDVLLLTTKIGGLGLNLIGADVVILVEHDWNPMNDKQAIDRVHRIGQKKTVNVYRLITKNTVEEKIMKLQNHKLDISSKLVTQQGNDLNNIKNFELMDLFHSEYHLENDSEESFNKKSDEISNNVTSGLTGKASGIVGNLVELWDESQYEEEYNLDNFIKKIK